MPNRIIRDWTDSEKINLLDANCERFFVRLMMKADDYGCFHGDPRLLKAFLFPMLLDAIRETDISRWAAACQKAGLIAFYEVESKIYIRITNFGQRLRIMKSKFPQPYDSDMRSYDSNPPPSADNCPPEEKPKRIETEDDPIKISEFKIENCKQPKGSQEYNIMAAAQEIYNGMREMHPTNLDLPEIPLRDWVFPIRELMGKKKYSYEQISGILNWIAEHENSFWRTTILDTSGLAKYFERLKAKYNESN